MLAAITATADQTDYTLADGDRLYVNSGYAADLNVTFQGDGRVFVADGAAVASADFRVDAGGSLGTTRVNFQGGSTAALINYVGAGGNDGIIIEDGAVVGNVILDASRDQGNTDASSVLLVAEDGVTRDIVHLGSRGVDRLYVRGTVSTGQIDASLGRGADEVRFYRGSRVRSSGTRSPIDIRTGAGNDKVTFSGGRLDSAEIRTGDGDDTFYIRGASQGVAFRGRLTVETGNGADTIDIRGTNSATDGYVLDSGAGVDRINVRQSTDPDNADFRDPDTLLIRTGTSGSKRDVVTLGAVRGLANVTLEAGGNVLLAEFAQSEYQRVTVFNESPSAVTTLRMNQSSTFDTMEVATEGRLDLIANVVGNDVAVWTNGTTPFPFGGGTAPGTNDRITLDGADVNAVDIFTGGGNDTIRFRNGTTIGAHNLDLGDGVDRVTYDAVTTLADVDIVFGGTSTNTNLLQMTDASFADDVVVDFDGRTNVVMRGRVDVDGRLFFKENSDTGRAGANRLLLRDTGTTTVNAFRIETGSAVNAQSALTARSLNLRSLGSTQRDFIDLSGATVTGTFAGSTQIFLEGGADDLRLVGTSFAGEVAIRLGNGNDVLDNTDTVFAGGGEIRGGAGQDFVADPDNGNLVGFELS